MVQDVLTTETAQGASVATSTKATTLTVQEFMKSQGFVSVVAVVRTNTNNYPYVTFINKDNEAENLYFSKKAAEDVDAGDEIAKGFFDPYVMVLAKNEAGEQRWKISSGNSLRIDAADLF